MTYARIPTTTEYDDEARWQRVARQPQPWEDIAGPTAADLADLRAEIAQLEETAAELDAEIAAMARARDPALARWQQLAEDCRRDLVGAREMAQRMEGGNA